MPVHFQLLSKETKKPVSLSAIDESICKDVLNVPVHQRRYGGGDAPGNFNWFDTIGFHIAIGKPLGSPELRNHFLESSLWAEEKPLIIKILDYLEEHYTSESFV